MNPDTAKTLNWQLSKRLGLDPSVPHTINAEGECGCYSSWTRDDHLRIWVEHERDHAGVPGYWTELTRFINDLVDEGQPESLEGVAEARIDSSADESELDFCRVAGDHDER